MVQVIKCLSTASTNIKSDSTVIFNHYFRFHTIAYGMAELTQLPLCMVFHRCYSLVLQMDVHRIRHIEILCHASLCPYLYQSIVKMLNFENVAISHLIRPVAISFYMLSASFVSSYQHLTRKNYKFRYVKKLKISTYFVA